MSISSPFKKMIIKINIQKSKMTTLKEYLDELSGMIASVGVSGFWSDEAKKNLINRAGQRVCNYHDWQDLELAQYINTRNQREYYDYPMQFKPNSIFQLTIGGNEYEKRSWADFEAEKNDGVSKFSSHDGYYFLDPIPADDLEIVVFGNRKWNKLTEDNDEAILPEQFDEAILKLALAGCLKKENRYNEANSEIAEVETPANPRVPNTGGILAKMKEREEAGDTTGYTGQISSSRFEM